ncbi:DUF3592 domain-containing protein [Chitinophaga arvensicola]|uniref:DUF3592 domain-containing protein n=1 Tax=Chitinophaga arvensicola TaxID=29529 RepID=A0A1I0SAC0_9BACT|nr:DUF3592 domain-containing protein [Chitinophaga arvensicola]SEW53092.1 Protein of unknown function [Chitinophaga arvensicola]
MGYSITLAIGLLLLVISLTFLQQSLSFLKTTNRTTGKVIDLATLSGSDGDTYSAVIRFYADNGQEYIYRQQSSSSPPTWEVGEAVTMAYDPGNPQRAKPVAYFSMFGVTVILMMFALPAIVIGGGYYLAQLVLK